MENDLKRRWCSAQREKPVLMGGVTFDISISVDCYTSSASPRTPIGSQRRLSETAVKLSSSYRNPMVKHEPD